jgi:hypothetical protein
MWTINVEWKRGRERPKRRWLDTIENDVRAVGVCSGGFFFQFFLGGGSSFDITLLYM